MDDMQHMRVKRILLATVHPLGEIKALVLTRVLSVLLAMPTHID